MSYWKNVSGMGQPIPIRQFNGVNIPDDEGTEQNETLFTWLDNFGDTKYPSLSTNPGYTTTLNGEKAIGMGVWRGVEIHIITASGRWMKNTPPSNTWTEIASGLDTSRDWTFCNFKGNFATVNLLASNGVGNIRKYDGAIVGDLATAPVNADYICTHSNRLYCAFENTVYFSALNKGEDWMTVDDAGSINVDTTDGEFIVALSPGITNLTIFKNSSMFELYGKGPQSYRLFPIAMDIGVVNNKSIAVHEEGLYFICRDGIYSYSGGVRPSKAWSKPVQDLIKRMSSEPKINTATSMDDHVYFTISVDSVRYTIDFNTKWGTFSISTNIQPYDMIRFKDTLYIGDVNNKVTKYGGKYNDGQNIKSVAITKPFTAELISQRQEWYKLWVVASMDVGASIKILINATDKGNNWVIINTIVADTSFNYRELLVPLNSVAQSHMVRIKIEAEGYVEIHEITRQTRQLPLRR